MSNCGNKDRKYDTKVNTALTFLLIVSFTIVSFSLNIIDQVLFMVVFCILFFYLILGVSYKVTGDRLIKSRFNIKGKTIEFNKLKYLRLFDRKFSLPIYNGMPIFLWGIKTHDLQEILDRINGVIDQLNDEEFEVICNNKKLLIEIIQNIFLMIILTISAYKVGTLYSDSNEAILYVIAAFVVFNSLWKAKKIRKI